MSSQKHIFILRHGAAEDIHRAIDSGGNFTNTATYALQNNPSFNRSHVDKLLSGHPSQVATAFKVQKHITPEDMDKFVSHPDVGVVTALARASWNPDHFSHLLKSPIHGKNPAMANWVLDMADRRGVLKKEHLDIASKHEHPDVRDYAATMTPRDIKEVVVGMRK